LHTDAAGRAISKTDDDGEPSYAEFGIALGDDVFFGNDSVAEVLWANTRSWREHVVLTADEDTTAAGLRRAKQRGWRTILAVNANPLELKRRAATHNKPVTNLSDVLATQLAVADPQSPITWEYLCEDDSSGTGFSYAPVFDCDDLHLCRPAVCANGMNAARCLRDLLCNQLRFAANGAQGAAVARAATRARGRAGDVGAIPLCRRQRDGPCPAAQEEAQ